MKIYVYAICKNEEKNIDEWVESMGEADDIFVLDTGSTDRSLKKLKEYGVHVKKEKIRPWRFDEARNKSLKMVPNDGDLYICTDLDERFNHGWRKILEEKYQKDYTRIGYTYNWSFDENDKPATTFILNKIHTRDYKWEHPVHEVLVPLKEEKILNIPEIVLNHYQKFKNSRKDYLPLLEMSVKESPEDDRNMHYLGREYMYVKRYDDAINMLHRHLNNPNAKWKDERCASMRFLGRCYNEKGYREEAIMWYSLAIDEAPYLRESYIELAYIFYNNQKYKDAMFLLDKAFLIKDKSLSYINESFAWDYHPYDLYALCAYYLNKKDIAKKYNQIAISLSPNNERLLNNELLFDENSVDN